MAVVVGLVDYLLNIYKIIHFLKLLLEMKDLKIMKKY